MGIQNELRTLVTLTRANLKSFTRDRAAIFWTLAFPILFIVLFGSIFSGGGNTNFDLGWVDQDGTPASGALRAGFDSTGLFKISDGTSDASLESMRKGDLDAVIVIPTGLGQSVTDRTAASIAVYTDPSQQSQSNTIGQIVTQIIGATNLALSGQAPILSVESRPLQTQDIASVAYFVPSILAMALMQLGVFSAIPLVEQREKGILKRLGATPLKRRTLVLSNILVRLLIALVQTVLIVVLGSVLFSVAIIGNLLVVAGFVVLGSVTFISIGYLLAAYAKTEESANALTSIVQFPLMFLSG
ncbi:MAG: ABC transporter permease, partial [Candidatus Limnocylindrales bacterium]